MEDPGGGGEPSSMDGGSHRNPGGSYSGGSDNTSRPKNRFSASSNQLEQYYRLFSGDTSAIDKYFIISPSDPFIPITMY